MDASVLQAIASIITAFSVLGAGLVAFYRFSRTSTKQAETDMFQRARVMLDSYEKDFGRKDRQINELQRQLNDLQKQNDYLRQELYYSQQSAARLAEALAQAGVPAALIQRQLDRP